MRILLGTHYLAKTGGTESYTYALAMELKRLGHEVEHFAIIRGAVSALLEEQGVPFMSSDSYDLIIANHTTVVETLWPKGYIIQTCHGNIAELEQPSPFADAYVAVSEEVREHLQGKGFRAAAVIPNGIDCNRFCPRKPVSPTLKTVLSLCQSDVANDFINRCCERAGIRFLRSNKFTDNVWSIEDMINESDLVVGLGRSAYDAMACGRPVLVYDYRDYMGEFLGDGMLTPESIGKSMSCNCSGRANRLKYDEETFIAELQKYSPELGAWSREFAVGNLNIEKAAEAYLNLYNGIDHKEDIAEKKKNTRHMKLSIITIAYNNLEGLKETYRSIRQQTFRDYEWIVIDGGSTDGTKEFLEEHDAELAYWCSEPDKGVYNAQNKGTAHAKGAYSIYMNSGDSFFADNVLEKVFERDIDADIIYGNWMLIFEDGKTRLGIAPEAADLAYFFDDNMCHQSMLIRTEAVRKRPYDESFRIYADWEEWLALLMQGKRFERIDMTVCNFMVGGISTGDNASEKLKEERREEIQRIKDRYYCWQWQQALGRVVPALKEYNALKNWMGSESTTSLSAAFGEREYLIKKRRKHNKIIRLLIYICSLLLIANILTLLCLLCK